jgi:RHS repeat-associated protein
MPSSTTYNSTGMESRSVSSEAYRFGFNGKEKDPEWTGQQGSHLDFGARIYDSRIGRWTALDPLAAKYPDLSPYAFVANSPIIYIDPDGRDIVPTNEGAARATSALVQKYDQGDVLEDVFQYSPMKFEKNGETYYKFGSRRLNNPYQNKKKFQKAMRKAGMRVEGEQLDEAWGLYKALVTEKNIEVEVWKPSENSTTYSPGSEQGTKTEQDVQGYPTRETENEELGNAIEYENSVTDEGLDHVMDQEGAEIEAQSSGEGYLFYENKTENPRKQGTEGIIIIDGRSNATNTLGNALKDINHGN